MRRVGLAAARAYVPCLLRRAIGRRDGTCLEGAWFLVSTPFAVGALSLLVATAPAVSAGAWRLAVVVAAGLRTWLALAAAPWYLIWKASIHLRPLASGLRQDDYYEPTFRA